MARGDKVDSCRLTVRQPSSQLDSLAVPRLIMYESLEFHLTYFVSAASTVTTRTSLKRQDGQNLVDSTHNRTGHGPD